MKSKEFLISDLKRYYEKITNNTCGVCPWLHNTPCEATLIHDAIVMLEETPLRVNMHALWLDTGSGQECSNCHEIQYGYDTGRFYCANCGARMDL